MINAFADVSRNSPTDVDSSDVLPEEVYKERWITLFKP